jgi:S-DNA-T family DNA segregation ATPase FtsK/SpoIIIE
MTTTTTALSEAQAKVVAKLAMKMAELNVTAKFVPPVSEGPLISAFRFLPSGSTRVAHLEALADDFAVALGTDNPVLVKRMPGESAVGIFVPNSERKGVDWLQLKTWYEQCGHLEIDAPIIPLVMGIDWLGMPFVDDLTLLPHLLVAGSTGSGKSTFLNALIATIVEVLDSRSVRLCLSDTKQVEFQQFTGLPHLMCPPATSVFQSLEMMEHLLEEMEARLKRIAAASARNILEYNSAADVHGASRMPYILLIIDELYDLMVYKGEKRGESKLASQKLGKLASKARATGIHIIASTQRPSVDVVEGVVKANFSARLTFRLPSEHDSRTVLSTGGAEHLMSRGDMLYLSPNRAGLQRLHAPMATMQDIRNAVKAAKGEVG